ncbi:cytochrome P450 704C1-like [Prosopis cineraria]|uniref:cytochrome P450 704C1-like n=1 Tax=Prosopis cineraria TaxID=364024 RepID=UPI00240F9F57|nr:cytochrome P450 704C1-like [Prosopis cineraria]
MNYQYLRDIIVSMITSKDTSANTLSWFFYMLCKHPLVQEKIVQEIRDVKCCQENDLDIDGFMDKITDLTLEKMHNLHAALTETLRLHPVVPMVHIFFNSDHVIWMGEWHKETDILPDGYKVKKGDIDFAYWQMKIVSMAILRSFRFKLANETKNVTYRTMSTLYIDKGLPLCAVPR